MATTTKIVLIMEYDGTRYYGFQLQLNQPTIQGETETAIFKLTGERRRLITASRTDTGVHARGQVVSFLTESPLPPETFVKALNHYLPEDIAVREAYRVDKSFNVRRNAVSREYNYYICNSLTRSPIMRGYSYFINRHLNIEAMNQACQALIGEHDFASFASSVEPKLKNTVRRIFEAGVKRNGETVIFNIVANSFLPHQVRNTVGTVVRIGLGKMNLDEFYSIMSARKFGLAGPTVPACGLCLVKINYPAPWSEIK